MDNNIAILLIVATFVGGFGLGSSVNQDMLLYFEDLFFPSQNIVNSLNTNPTTFSATTCSDTTVDEESVTHIAGKFTNGDSALDSVDIGVGLIDNNGDVVDAVVFTLYDLSQNETRFFDEAFYDVAGIWKTCEFQVESVFES